ncbi:hypothetical protein Q033_04038 [Pseudomonas aeruginosa BWHPSA020]|nr:hypothetical protein Q033_04038 [Pseudomonas aeruginosa BWHPSA020]WBJ11173.1 hypothetical protein PALA55_03792 [Pseudomonas aeruginosa]
MRSPLATIACACLLLGGCSKSAEDSANPLLGKDAECLELFARSNALYCDIREDERESQAKGTPRRHTDYEVADAAYLLKATGERCAIDTTYVTECSAKAGQWLQKARAKAAKPWSQRPRSAQARRQLRQFAAQPEAAGFVVGLARPVEIQSHRW